MLPVANFTATPLTGLASLSVAFTDTSTNTPTSRLWSFGDGHVSTAQNPTHVYDQAGEYTVTLVATNVDGSDTEIKVLYISVGVPNLYSVPSNLWNGMTVTEKRLFNYYFLGGPQNKDISYADGLETNITIVAVDTAHIGSAVDAELDPLNDVFNIKTFRKYTMTQNPILGMVTGPVGSEINGTVSNFKQMHDIQWLNLINLTYHRVKTVTSFNI